LGGTGIVLAGGSRASHPRGCAYDAGLLLHSHRAPTPAIGKIFNHLLDDRMRADYSVESYLDATDVEQALEQKIIVYLLNVFNSNPPLGKT